MPHDRYSSKEIVQKGEEIYARDLQASLEPAAVGQFVVIDIETFEYELDADQEAAIDRAISRHPDGARYIKRVGYAAAHTIGGQIAGSQTP